ncbi:MAG: hypothetical protein HOP19_15160, partial [Acidobacteria bacterium]|nr:hypothetical protein [Acidobacteriota bacterium]
MNEYQNQGVVQGAHGGFNQPSDHPAAAALITPELLHSFVVEVKGYLPRIENGIAEFFDEPAVMERLAEAHGYAHTIKKAAHVMGMLPLANLAERLQGLLEQLAVGALPLQWTTLQGFRQVVAQLGIYLDHSAIGGALPPTELIEALYTLEHPYAVAAATEAASAPVPAPEPVPETLAPPQMYVLSEEFQPTEVSFETDPLAEPATEYYAEPTINARNSGRLTMPEAAATEWLAEPQPIMADFPPVYVLTSQYEAAPYETDYDTPLMAAASYAADGAAHTFIASELSQEPEREVISESAPLIAPVIDMETAEVADSYTSAPTPDWWSQHYVEEAAQSSPYAVTSHLEPLAVEPVAAAVSDFAYLQSEVLSVVDEPITELRTTQELPAIRLEAGCPQFAEVEAAPEISAVPPPPPAPPYPFVPKTTSGVDVALIADAALAEDDVPTQELPKAAPMPWDELPLEPIFTLEAETPVAVAFVAEAPVIEAPVMEAPVVEALLAEAPVP